eukprot:scaffold66226_cov37-Phaeocystis_antarctica.AAC.1
MSATCTPGLTLTLTEVLDYLSTVAALAIVILFTICQQVIILQRIGACQQFCLDPSAQAAPGQPKTPPVG